MKSFSQFIHVSIFLVFHKYTRDKAEHYVIQQYVKIKRLVVAMEI